jgi:hypothetical protein
MKNARKLAFQPPFWKKLRQLQTRPTAVAMAPNFGHCSHSSRSYIFGYGRRPSAFGPILNNLALLSVTQKKITAQDF